MALSVTMMALVVGALLGVIFAIFGAGGGLLAVPAMMLCFDASMGAATGASLVVVWVAAASGAVVHWRAGRVDRPALLAFGLPSVVGAPLGTWLHALVPEQASLGAFAVVVTLAAGAMLKPPSSDPRAKPTWVLVGIGLGTGALTGFLGVGGGFVLVPALLLGAALPMQRAVGTSMAIISVASFVGALSHLAAGHVQLGVVLPMAVGSMVGVAVGGRLSGRLPERALRVGFVVVALLVAGWVAWRALNPH